jgi:hypothetical protein
MTLAPVVVGILASTPILHDELCLSPRGPRKTPLLKSASPYAVKAAYAKNLVISALMTAAGQLQARAGRQLRLVLGVQPGIAFAISEGG